MRVMNGVEVLTTLEELVDPEYTAVLVIDMQNGIVYGDREYDPANIDATSLMGRAVAGLQQLLAAAREKGVTITYAEILHYDAMGMFICDGPNMFCHREKDPGRFTLREGQPVSQTMDALAPQPGDFIARKNRASAFSGTMLDAYLKSKGIKSVIITGTSTRGCVLMTAVDCQMHGYYPVVLRDCVATGSERWQEIALMWMESEMAISTSEEVLSVWKG